jgi:CPA1 family monovalent cation:H+ antiporter
LRFREPLPPARQIFIAGWTGTLGVISLAAAITLPHAMANGTPFEQRYLIIFLAFSVILAPLVLIRKTCLLDGPALIGPHPSP